MLDRFALLLDCVNPAASLIEGDDERKLERARILQHLLIENGINAGNMTAKGYGKSMPAAANKKLNGKDNPEGRQLNRRTEFKIIGEVPVTVLSEDIPEEMKIKKK